MCVDDIGNGPPRPIVDMAAFIKAKSNTPDSNKLVVSVLDQMNAQYRTILVAIAISINSSSTFSVADVCNFVNIYALEIGYTEHIEQIQIQQALEYFQSSGIIESTVNSVKGKLGKGSRSCDTQKVCANIK